MQNPESPILIFVVKHVVIAPGSEISSYSIVDRKIWRRDFLRSVCSVSISAPDEFILDDDYTLFGVTF